MPSSPAKLSSSTVARLSEPRTSGRYGAERLSVSTWNTSVSAWPSPYEKKSAAKARTWLEFEADGASAIPASAAEPVTKHR